MINTGKPFNIHDYIEILLRRIWFIIIPFVVIMGATVLYAFFATKEYRATTLVMVTRQKVPEDFVKATVTAGVQDNLQSIATEIMSRTRLEQIIAEFNLYPKRAQSSSMEGIVDEMRRRIDVEIQSKEGKEDSFTISYVGQDPKVVTLVTNKLAFLFIEENLRFREQQAQGTTEFLSTELNATKATLEEQEKAITQFKEQHMGELPEQQEANLRVLEQLRMQYDRIGDNMRTLQDRKSLFQKQLSDLETYLAAGSSSLSPSSPLSPLRKPSLEDSYKQQLAQLKNDLVELQAMYTEKHPDIIKARMKIADLEARVESIRMGSVEETETERGSQGSQPTQKPKIDVKMDPRYKEIEDQMIAIDMEMKRLQADEATTRAQIAKYLERIENTPSRELTMNLLTRDYQNTKEAYQSLLRKREEAHQGENLERYQKGEQFRVIDPARVPEKPFKPDIPKTLFYGLMMGLGCGFGMAFLREQMDHSFRDAEDLETTLGLKVLANVPRVEKMAA